MSDEIVKRGGEIFLKSPVIQVVVHQNSVIGVETKHGTHRFEKVISTVPIINLPKLIPELPNEIKINIQSLENIGVVCVIVKLRKSLTDYFWLNTNDSEMDIPGLVEFSNLRKLSDHVVYVPFYLPQTHPNFQDDDLVFESKVKMYLNKINQKLEGEDFVDIKVNRYKYAQPICQPGHMSKLPPIKLPIEGLWAADTSYYYPEDRGISESIALGRNIAKRIDEISMKNF